MPFALLFTMLIFGREVEVADPTYPGIEIEQEDPMDNYTQEEIDLLARVAMSEASVMPIEAKQAVVEVILNRVDNEDYPDNVEDVVYQPNAFSTQDNGDPNEDCYAAVEAAIKYRAFPKDMVWFRMGHVDYGHLYMKISSYSGRATMVFSTIEDYEVSGKFKG